MMTVRGHFQDVATSGLIDPSTPTASSIEVTINVASLTTNNPQRDHDLRSSYFLELDKVLASTVVTATHERARFAHALNAAEFLEISTTHSLRRCGRSPEVALSTTGGPGNSTQP